MSGTPESPGSPEGQMHKPDNENPFALLTPEEQAAEAAQREADQLAIEEAHKKASETGEPYSYSRDTITLDPNEMSGAAKVAAMKRSGMTKDQIQEYFEKEGGAS